MGKSASHSGGVDGVQGPQLSLVFLGKQGEMKAKARSVISFSVSIPPYIYKVEETVKDKLVDRCTETDTQQDTAGDRMKTNSSEGKRKQI